MSSEIETKSYELPSFLKMLNYKKIITQFCSKFKKYDIWFTKLDFINRIQHINLLEEGVDKFIKQDKSEELKDYIIVKIYLKSEEN